MVSYRILPNSGSRLLRVLAAAFLAGLLADQVTKSWAVSAAVEPVMLIPGYVLAYSVLNPGLVLGMGGEHALTGSLMGLLGCFWVAWLIRSAYLDRERWRDFDAVACGILLAGILGNTIDRLFLGGVRDFLVVWLNPYLAFNIADLFVLLGGVTLVVSRALADWSERRIARLAPAA